MLQWRLLEVTSLAANHDLTTIAKKLHTQVHRVQYAYRSLIDKGFIKGRVAFIDYSRLGRINASCVLAFDQYDRTIRQRTQQVIKKEKAISWASEIVGDGQVVINVFTTTLSDVRSIIASLQRSLGQVSFSHKIAIRLKHYSIENRYSGHEYQHSAPRKLLYASSGESTNVVVVDELDRKCLRALSEPNFHSIDSLARTLGESKATVHRRIKQLETQQVIQGYHWNLDQKSLGISRFRLLLTSHRLDPNFERHLERVAQQDFRVTNVALCLGDWDYELSLEIRNGENIHEVVSTVMEHLAEPSIKYTLYQNVEYFKYSFSGL